MGITINAPQPDKPLSGESLMKGSVAGRKTQLINDSSVGAAPITIPAGSDFGVNFVLSLWHPDIPTASRTPENMVTPENCIAWIYADYFVDNDADGNYALLNGPSLSVDQRKVSVSQVVKRSSNIYSGSVLYSDTVMVRFYNNGSSSHTVYAYAYSKYMIYGDSSL